MARMTEKLTKRAVYELKKKAERERLKKKTKAKSRPNKCEAN